ncbi:hypothetical protein [Massilia sp. Mn16-1_5]|uniref:hypothetical protein n=1 Tax=Massilia sp. Mn16-1_5 TaxID=2079199 RepID=UPI00109EC7FE|nr:hypothetical protein [Massilia sp. Mn16-1_5]
MRTYLVLGMIALMSACSREMPSSPPLPAAPAAALLSAGGIGPIRFGMSLAQAEQATGGKAALPQAFDPACSMVRFPALPNLRFMVENGIVTRADAGPGVDNAVGVSYGDTLEQVRSRHPKAQVSAHKYDENGNYVSFPSADGRAAIILEVTGGKVTKMRAGLQPAVAYVETCG